MKLAKGIESYRLLLLNAREAAYLCSLAYDHEGEVGRERYTCRSFTQLLYALLLPPQLPLRPPRELPMPLRRTHVRSDSSASLSLISSSHARGFTMLASASLGSTSQLQHLPSQLLDGSARTYSRIPLTTPEENDISE